MVPLYSKQIFVDKDDKNLILIGIYKNQNFLVVNPDQALNPFSADLRINFLPLGYPLMIAPYRDN